MAKAEGNAHGKHYTEAEKEADELRNHNEATGRQHFAPEADEKAGGHSDRSASARHDEPGQMHEFSDEKNKDEVNRHNKAQDEGGMQGESRNAGGHQGGRHQHN
jgi:hypothetical protein